MTPPITALGSRYGIQGALGRSVKRASAGGWWLTGGIPAANCIAAYQAKGAASLAASYTNLANMGTYDLTVGNAPEFDASTGWNFNNDYLITGIVPDTLNWSMIFRFSDAAASIGAIGIVNSDALSGFYIVPNRFTNVRRYKNGSGSAKEYTPVQTSGVMAVAGMYCYLNGSQDGSQASWTSYTPVYSIYIGALRSSTTIYYGALKIQAVAIYNTVLSSTQVGLLTAAMAAL